MNGKEKKWRTMKRKTSKEIGQNAKVLDGRRNTETIKI
jgi:hypothetical protein